MLINFRFAKKLSFLLLIFWLGVQPILGQNASRLDSAALFMQGVMPADTTKISDTKKSKRPQRLPADETSFLNHFGVGISGGTKNYIGVDLLINIISQLHVRLGYNQFDFDFTDIESNIGSFTNQNLAFTGTINQSNIEVLFEWGVLNGWLRFVAGPVFAIDNQINSDFSFTENIQINDIVIPADEVGSGSINIDHSFSVFPYLGIGVGRSLPWRRVGLNLDVGTYYKGTPKLGLGTTGLIQANAENESILNRNLRQEPVLSLWPVVSLRLAYRIL